jgi:plasmid replication initiation protein
MAMAIALKPTVENRTVTFTFGDFCRTLGLERGGKSHDLFTQALDECMHSFILLEDFERSHAFHWWEQYDYDRRAARIDITFSSQLVPYLDTLRNLYAAIPLTHIGKLKSMYAIRFFELAKSYESYAGKKGNPPKSWFFTREIADLRHLLGLEAKMYHRTAEFHRNIIDLPLEEFNAAGLGYKITAEPVKNGRTIVAFRFCAEKTAPKVKTKDGEALQINESHPADHAQYENNRLKALYESEFAELYAAELAKIQQTPLFQGKNAAKSPIARGIAEAEAVKALKNRHGWQA